MEDIKQFWETCDTAFAHITINKHLKNYKSLTDYWDVQFLRKLNTISPLINKTIVDYGIGGGHTGIHLHNRYKIHKYIGLDISERQIEIASKNLLRHQVNHELKLVPIEFNNIPCDVFISQAVIQHFPDNQYLNNFLDNINKSNILIIMLQIRYNINTIFTNNKYNTIKEVAGRCHTNNNYIIKYLTKYNNIYQGNILSNQYQFLIYQLKS